MRSVKPLALQKRNDLAGSRAGIGLLQDAQLAPGREASSLGTLDQLRVGHLSATTGGRSRLPSTAIISLLPFSPSRVSSSSMIAVSHNLGRVVLILAPMVPLVFLVPLTTEPLGRSATFLGRFH